MKRSTFALSVVFCCVIAGNTVAQNQPCDEIVNTGETDCIYEIVGQDQCLIEPTNACPAGAECKLFTNVGTGSQFIACESALEPDHPQISGYEDNGVTTTVPKWSAPTGMQNGNGSSISFAIACGVRSRCYCDPDIYTGKVYCRSKVCGLTILWSLEKNADVSCTAPSEPL